MQNACNPAQTSPFRVFFFFLSSALLCSFSHASSLSSCLGVYIISHFPLCLSHQVQCVVRNEQKGLVASFLSWTARQASIFFLTKDPSMDARYHVFFVPYRKSSCWETDSTPFWNFFLFYSTHYHRFTINHTLSFISLIAHYHVE